MGRRLWGRGSGGGRNNVGSWEQGFLMRGLCELIFMDFPRWSLDVGTPSNRDQMNSLSSAARERKWEMKSISAAYRKLVALDTN